ncbi:methylmalonyl Co-A mutase-associated GTPase MeaB [Aeromicrobium sp.]|uniref:methylmalonyl Co-A mutase-associated GTPase MeaB n=1 Tax=Aeromicrobium sp. TaxID=1871063 RepID=UPI002FC603F9
MEPNLAAQAASRVKLLAKGNRADLARVLTILSYGDDRTDALAGQLALSAAPGRVISITGPPGAGKSTLVSAMLTALRKRGLPVAVLAIDPSSPLTGGGILGDRIRMERHTDDLGVFVRSLGARNHGDGIADNLPAMIDAMAIAGWPLVLVETVGVGQSETGVFKLADISILVSVPGLGDDVQTMKAGVLELADIHVVNKSDLPGADIVARQLKGMLRLRGASGAQPPVLTTDATTGQGVDELLDAIEGIGFGERTGGRRARIEAQIESRVHRAVKNELADALRQCSKSISQAADGAIHIQTVAQAVTIRIAEGLKSSKYAGDLDVESNPLDT